MIHPLLTAAERITATLLLPDAPVVDRADRVPEEHFSALAEAGLYGVEAAEALVDTDRWLITEVLASGCMSTAFVWIQHHSAVRALLGSGNAAMRRAWIDDLLAGRRTAGIAIGGVRPPTPSLQAAVDGSGWRLTGDVPWVTGWGLVDAFLVGAATLDGREVWSLVTLDDRLGLAAERHRLVAADASVTVRLTFDEVLVHESELIGVEPRRLVDPGDGGGRSNGSLALGVVRRAVALMGPSRLDEELEVVRRRLDEAGEAGMAAARAVGSELALRAAARFTVHTGSGAVDSGGPAERLSREAQFTAVFGTRPAIKTSLLGLLDGVLPPVRAT